MNFTEALAAIKKGELLVREKYKTETGGYHHYLRRSAVRPDMVIDYGPGSYDYVVSYQFTLPDIEATDWQIVPKGRWPLDIKPIYDILESDWYKKREKIYCDG